MECELPQRRQRTARCGLRLGENRFYPSRCRRVSRCLCTRRR